MKVDNLLLVKRAMKFMPWTVQPSDSVAHARTLLDEYRITHLPVLLKGQLVGIVSTRDLHASKLSRSVPAIKRVLETRPDRVTVASVMTTNVHIATPSDTLGHAASIMRREHVGALPVVEEAHLRGIITRSDIIAAFLALGAGNTMKHADSRDRRAFIRTPYRRAKRSHDIHAHGRGNHQVGQAGRGQTSPVGARRTYKA